MLDNPSAPISKIFRVTNLDEVIEGIWNEKIKTGVIRKDAQLGIDNSSLNGHIIEPGKIGDPATILRAALAFLFAPIPFLGEQSLAVSLASLESPLWWALYALLIFQLFRFRSYKLFHDPSIAVISIFLIGEIVFSALIEVNLGTSFRHRSILLMPLMFLYLRTWERREELVRSVN